MLRPPTNAMQKTLKAATFTQCIQLQQIAKTIFHYFNSMLHFYVSRDGEQGERPDHFKKGMKVGKVILKKYTSTRRQAGTHCHCRIIEKREKKRTPTSLAPLFV